MFRCALIKSPTVVICLLCVGPFCRSISFFISPWGNLAPFPTGRTVRRGRSGVGFRFFGGTIIFGSERTDVGRGRFIGRHAIKINSKTPRRRDVCVCVFFFCCGRGLKSAEVKEATIKTGTV